MMEDQKPMTEEQRKEIKDLITKNPDAFTPRMVWDIFWCAKHEEDIRKMMGMLPCDSEELYRIQDLFLMEGQTGLYFAMVYKNIYGKTDDEIAEEEKRIKRYKKNQPEKRQPYDFDLELKYQEDSFLAWCDDSDCAALIRKKTTMTFCACPILLWLSDIWSWVPVSSVKSIRNY